MGFMGPLLPVSRLSHRAYILRVEKRRRASHPISVSFCEMLLNQSMGGCFASGLWRSSVMALRLRASVKLWHNDMSSFTAFCIKPKAQ